MKSWIIIQKICSLIFAIFVLGGIGFLFEKPTKKLFELQEQKAQLKNKNAELLMATEELKRNQEKFIESKDFVERIAKKEYRLIRADECVFKFENE